MRGRTDCDRCGKSVQNSRLYESVAGVFCSAKCRKAQEAADQESWDAEAAYIRQQNDAHWTPFSKDTT